MSKLATRTAPPPIPARVHRAGEFWGNQAYIDKTVEEAAMAERIMLAAYVNDLATGKADLGVQLFASNVLEYLQRG